MLVFAVMPPAAWPTAATDGVDEADGAGVGVALNEVKLEPMIRSMVPGVRVEFCSTCTLLSRDFSVLTAGRSEAAAYWITESV